MARSGEHSPVAGHVLTFVGMMRGDTAVTLKWELAPGRRPDEPRDIQADTAILDHGYWSAGPDVNDSWSLTLVEQDPSLNETFLWQWMNLAGETAAKNTAQEVETAGRAAFWRDIGRK